MVRRGNACKVEHGADDLLTRYGGGAGAGGDAADPTPGPGPSDWQSLLEETKVVQVQRSTCLNLVVLLAYLHVSATCLGPPTYLVPPCLSNMLGTPRTPCAVSTYVP